MKKLSLLVLLSLLALPSFAEKIDLGGGKALLLILPATWTDTGPVSPPPGVSIRGINVRYVPKGGSNDAVLITIITVPDDRLSDRETLKEVVEQSTAQFVPGSVEGKAELKDFKIGAATGFSATFTDASLVGKPSVKEDYKALTTCFVYLGQQVMLTATVFTDDLGGPAYAEGLRLLKSISLQQPKNTI